MNNSDFPECKENYDFASRLRILMNKMKDPRVLRLTLFEQMAYVTPVPHFLHLLSGNNNNSKEPSGVFVRNNTLILVKLGTVPGT